MIFYNREYVPQKKQEKYLEDLSQTTKHYEVVDDIYSQAREGTLKEPEGKKRIQQLIRRLKVKVKGKSNDYSS